jgi:hypothetical protein
MHPILQDSLQVDRSGTATGPNNSVKNIQKELVRMRRTVVELSRKMTTTYFAEAIHMLFEKLFQTQIQFL